MITLIKLTENDKRILLAIFLVVILVFLLIGLLTNLVKKIMAKQGKDVDTYMYDVTKANLVTNGKEFRKIARIKNFQKFYKTIRLPSLLLLLGTLVLLQYCFIKSWDLSFYFSNDKGIGSLFYQWDWANAEKASLLGIKTFIPSKWPDIINAPHFVTGEFLYEGLTTYISFPLFLVGLILYIGHLVGFIARDIQARKLSKSVFQKSLTPTEPQQNSTL